MRQRSLSFLILVALLLAPLLAAAPEALRTPAHEGVIHTSDVTWSGNMSLAEDVTIATGATLTIEAGTNINVTEDITIRIEGDLDIDGTQADPITIWGSHFEDTSVQARWEGFQVANGAVAEISDLNLSDARGGFLVEYGAVLTVPSSSSASFTNVIVGIYAIGDLDVQGALSCVAAGASCLLLDGDASIAMMVTVNTGQGIRVTSTGDLDLDYLQSVNTGEAIVLDDGSTSDVLRIVHTGDGLSTIRATGDIDAHVNLLETSGTVRTVLDISDVAGLRIDDASGSVPIAENFLKGQNIRDVSIAGLYDLTGVSGWMVDAEIDGWLDVEASDLSAHDLLRLRGDGQFNLSGSIIDANQIADVAGEGTLRLDEIDISAAKGGQISGWDIEMNQVDVTFSQTGFSVLSGHHELDEVMLGRVFDSSDSTSVGLNIVWASVEVNDVMISGFNEGVRCAAQCDLHGDTLSTGGGGRNSGSGLTVEGGSVNLDSITTSSSDVGIDLDSGDIHLSNWTVDMAHRSYGIELANDATAAIRHMPGYTSSGAFDAFGDGTLLWGSTGSPNMAVSIEAQFTESNVKVTDVVGTALPGAQTSAHGFTEVADSFGDTSLPLLSEGSFVEALDASSGMGASAMLSPPGGTLQIAVIPETGDWTIPTGVHARLSGGDFTLNGDLIIESTASLMLTDATLNMPDAANLTMGVNGLLKGDGGVLVGGIASLSAGTPFVGSGDGLSVGSDIAFTCYDPWTWVLTDIEGDLSLSQDCELYLDGGHAAGLVSLGANAHLREQNHLLVTILDAGMVVEGANVSVGGSVVATDVNGQAAFVSTWRVVDESGETLVEVKTVVAQHANVNRYRSWDPSSSGTLEIMISTVTPGATTGLVRLEPIFSPYHLGADLLVSAGTTFDVLPDVELTIAPTVGITVEGVMRAEDAWIGGTASNGIIPRSTGELTMSDGFYSGGALTVQSSATLSSMTISDAPIQVQGSLSMTGGSVSNTDVCMHAEGVVAMVGTIFTDCGMYALWATNAALEVSDLTLGAGNSNGAWIQQGSGNLTGWNATGHNGDGPALHLHFADDELSVFDMTLSSGSGEAALLIEQSDGLTVSDSTITGSRGASIQSSEARLLRVEFIPSAPGSGVAIEVLGVPAVGTIIEDCDIDDFALGLRLEGGLDDTESAGVILLDTRLDSQTAIEANTLPFTVNGGILDGDIEMIAIDKPFTATLIDHDPSVVDITGGATLYIAHTWSVDSPVPVQLQITIPEFEAMLADQQLIWDAPDIVILTHRAYTESGMSDALFGDWTANAAGYLPATGQVQLDETTSRLLTIELSPNAAPVVTITGPDTLEANAGESLDISATAVDSNGDEIAEWVWTLESGGESYLVGDIASIRIDDLEQGGWTLRATAIDVHGSAGDDTVSLTVNPADADDDFSDTCPQQGSGAWWDAENGWLCGPDVYDEDDDNDGIRDDRDRFPRDPCAHRDTDDDGLPDSIIDGCETDLVADEDDDGDEVPDSEDLDPTNPEIGRTPASDSGTKSWIATVCSPAVVLSVAVIIVFTIFAYMRSNASLGRED